MSNGRIYMDLRLDGKTSSYCCFTFYLLKAKDGQKNWASTKLGLYVSGASSCAQCCTLPCTRRTKN